MKIFNWKWRTLLLSAAVVMAVGSGCVSSGDNTSALVGHWVLYGGVASGKPEVMELFKDGTGVVDNAVVAWKVENKRFIMLSGGVAITADYKVDGYELILTYDSGKREGLAKRGEIVRKTKYVKKGKLEEYKKKKEEEERKKEEWIKKEVERAMKEAGRAKKEAEKRHEKISSYFTDSRDGQKYRAVKIGGKSWMAENLNYQTDNSWCYDGDNSNCEKYGRLYDMNTARTVCPSGWHLPSGEEWERLVETTCGTDEEDGIWKMCKILQSVRGWVKLKDGSSGNNADDFGFTALPGGYRNYDGEFDGAAGEGNWWMGGERPGFKGDGWNITIRFSGGMHVLLGSNTGNSVRCIAD